MSHLHIHLHDARRKKRRRDAVGFEPAKHPRGKGGHFMPGGGEHVEAEGEQKTLIGRGHAMPITTGTPPKRHDCTCK